MQCLHFICEIACFRGAQKTALTPKEKAMFCVCKRILPFWDFQVVFKDRPLELFFIKGPIFFLNTATVAYNLWLLMTVLMAVGLTIIILLFLILPKQRCLVTCWKSEKHLIFLSHNIERYSNILHIN